MITFSVHSHSHIEIDYKPFNCNNGECVLAWHIPKAMTIVFLQMTAVTISELSIRFADEIDFVFFFLTYISPDHTAQHYN